MIAAFRCDASLEMGTGHVMRCLTLAQVLKASGVQCHFICRDHPGNLIELVRTSGFVVHALTRANSVEHSPALAHAHWLGSSQDTDAQACCDILKHLGGNVSLIVDHYALDARWESAMRSICQRILVIDDLADRTHDCDVLVDQTLGRHASEYGGLLPDSCSRLCGSNFALLRNEFLSWRAASLQRRERSHESHRILVSLGGVDMHNLTGGVLTALSRQRLPADCVITVVMGGAAPWVEQVRAVAEAMPVRTEVLVNVKNMAELMALSDLAIGAAGSTAWERCCLGLPSFMFVLADNQQRIAQELVKAGAALLLPREALDQEDGLLPLVRFLASAQSLKAMSMKAHKLVDGLGTRRVADVFMCGLN